ncbi:dexh-box atp-dependent rna helicase dexh10 [Quercus suber]|uniref:Dexh-box atp-dependent rna helicase dexh10 n=1 Tax=Quercus suber TaxID=58331 RepID=A0AAW0KSD4_QUESU
MSMSKLDFNSQEEKDTVEEVFRNAIQCLNEEDRNLPAIELMLPLLQRGIAVHHSGLLPVIKELVEILFQEGLVKALFATETFAMGLNMPAKTVVFTAVKKWDGDSHRLIGSGEYIQMSGRAGRRGKDERGICIIMIDEQMEMNALKDMVLGKPAPLVSTFRLSYYSILNLMSRAEGQFTAEHVIKNSFHQFQYEKDMGIEDSEIVELVNQIEELERKLYAHPLHKSQDVHQMRSFQRKAEVNHEIQQLKSKMRDSQLKKFRDELKNRSRVLKKLGHIDADGVVQLKGRAACLIDTGDELLVTELMFNGTFNDLDHHQIAALSSCFIPGDKSSEQIQLRTELGRPLQQLQESARRIAEIQHECKLDVNVDEYVESTGANFEEVIQMTDIFEGSIIRSARRLDEFLNQLRTAAQAVGEANLENKFAAASESLRRGIMFANSLSGNEDVSPIANARSHLRYLSCAMSLGN